MLARSSPLRRLYWGDWTGWWSRLAAMNKSGTLAEAPLALRRGHDVKAGGFVWGGADI